ncbi:MAG TPA: M28 family peptidase [Conexibacter sp.]|nr:M28 family peptidase [Conexibacter sp.]
MDHLQAYEHVVRLAGESGPRLAATPAARAAEQQLTRSFDELGLQLDRHEFRQPSYRSPESALRVLIDGAWTELEHQPVWFAGDTGPTPVRGEIVAIGTGAEGYVRGIDPAGKVLLISRDSYIDYPDDLLYRRLLEWRPAAVLFTTNAGAHAPLDTFFDWEKSEHAPPPPAAVIHYRDAARLIHAGATEAELLCRFEVEEGSCANILATLPGTDPEAGAVIVAAHYDTAPTGAGAIDNAGGSAMVLCLAQWLAAEAAAGRRRRRAVKFVIYSGHETGLHGPRALVRDRPELLEETVFALNFDVVGAPIHLNAIYGVAAPSVIDAVRAQVDELGFDWPVAAAVVPYDTWSLSGGGVPWINLGQGMTNWLHTDADTVDRVHPEAFRAPLAFSRAVLDWATEAETVEQGYPEALTASVRAYSEFSGWELTWPGDDDAEA